VNLTFREPPKDILWEQRNAYTNRLGLMWFGPADVMGDEVWVEAGYVCGVTCGHGTTYVLRFAAGRWAVIDEVGDSWWS
jgi:hypothetical protein